MTAWVVERHRGTAAELHERHWPDPVVPTIWVCEPTRPALVVGSVQEPPSPDALDDHVDVVVRQSGGGAVLLEPGNVGWLDVFLPPADRRWMDDVGRSFLWLGQAWADALGGEAQVHDGALVQTRWSSDVCFAGRGPGEVLIEDRKVVGLSQRRTRRGARFQALVLGEWDPEPLVRHLGLPAHADGELRPVAAGVGTDRLEEVTTTAIRHIRSS